MQWPSTSGRRYYKILNLSARALASIVKGREITIMAQNSNFGICPCGGRYESREVTVAMRGIELKEVPQGACPNCGARVYKVSMLECIARLMKLPSPKSTASASSPSNEPG